MVAPDPEMASQGGEAESTLRLQPPENHHHHHLHLHTNNNNNGHSSSSLGRQSSIYSLTLDEFQHTLCETGRHFGSMNMDEFLTSIWNAEESHTHAPVTHNFVMGHHGPDPANNTNNDNNLPRLHPSLARQGSLSLPEPLCRKTVDEVWAEIRKNQQEPPSSSGSGDRKFLINNTTNLNGSNNNNLVVTATMAAGSNPTTTHERQVTFGEMTLEDFLVRAGVVREHAEISAPPTSLTHHHQHQQQYSIYQNNNNDNTTMNPTTYGVERSVMGLGGGGGGTPYRVLPQQPPPLLAAYGGRMGNGSGGGAVYGHAIGGLGSSQASPTSPDGHQGGDGGNPYGLEDAARMRGGGGGGGRKRVTDGPVEVVVERRQRRMIKNRESAARSRARKQAYTVELEAELNQLKEENANLKRALEEMERKRKEEEVHTYINDESSS